MGYELHITRRTQWHDDEQASTDISLEEWLSYIDKDKELEMSDNYWTKVPGNDSESQVSPGYCEWTRHPAGDQLGFHYSYGSISAKNPDDATIGKMVAISKILNARVQGDNGEVYGLTEIGKVFTKSPDSFDITRVYKPWWKFW